MEKIRIQDDLYTYVNQAKLDELVIPDDMPIAGGFAALNTDVEKLMIGDFNDMCKSKVYPNDYLERACTLFMLAKDVKRKKKHGIKPALKHLAILKKLGTLRGYNLHAKELILKNIAMPLSIMVEPNMKDTTHHCVMVQGPSVILPDTSFEESGHLSSHGSLDMNEIIKALVETGFTGYFRPDHGRMIWGETGKPGYGLFDRALGSAYINGLVEANGGVIEEN